MSHYKRTDNNNINIYITVLMIILILNVSLGFITISFYTIINFIHALQEYAFRTLIVLSL